MYVEFYIYRILHIVSLCIMSTLGMKYYRNDDFLKEIGKRIRTAREAKGLTQDELAFRCGDRHNSQLSMMETGKTNFTISLLFLISQHLEMSPKDFLPES